jgi:hypothetical protein
MTTMLKLSAGVNVSYLYSNQQLDSKKDRNWFSGWLYKHKGKFTGASNLLMNADNFL